jgi:hypothetical protein
VIVHQVFAYFIIGLYSAPTLQGQFEEWATNKALIEGFVPGDTAGNWAFAAHMILPAIIEFSGLLQLAQHIRARALAFHRWNGRIFMLAVLAASRCGLYLTWVCATSRNYVSALAISKVALPITVFAVLAWCAARAHNIAAHRRWTLRTGSWRAACGSSEWATSVGF